MLERIFKDIHLINDITKKGIRASIKGGVTVYTEAEPCTGVSILLNGQIRVYKIGHQGREITLYEVNPGQVCILNVFCVLSGMTYPANAETVKDTEVITIPSNEFKNIFDEFEEFRGYIFGLLSERILEMMELIDEVVFRRVDRRLWQYLTQKANGNILKKTHQEIAFDLGTSREVVSRLLKDFERRGLVRLSRGVIKIL